MVEVMKKVSENFVKNAKEARKKFRGALVLDISKRGGMGYLSPECEWRGIEIEGREEKGNSVKGIWEGLKIFRSRKEVDMKYWMEEGKLGKDRGCKTYGPQVGMWWNGDIIGIEEGVEKMRDLYRREVKRRYAEVIERIRKEGESRVVVLLEDGENERKIPFSHGMILKELIEEKEIA